MSSCIVLLLPSLMSFWGPIVMCNNLCVVDSHQFKKHD